MEYVSYFICHLFRILFYSILKKYILGLTKDKKKRHMHKLKHKINETNEM